MILGEGGLCLLCTWRSHGGHRMHEWSRQRTARKKKERVGGKTIGEKSREGYLTSILQREGQLS